MMASARSIRRERVAPALDLGGVTLVAVLIGWFLVAGSLSGGDPGSLVGVAGLSLVGLLLGMTAAAFVDPLVAPALVIAVAVGIAVVSAGDLAASEPLGRPFGYANATGAFYVQASIAGVIVATIARTATLQAAGWTAAAGFTVVVFASRSVAAAALVVVLPLTALAIASWWRSRIAIGLLGGLFAVTLALTITVGATHPSNGILDATVVSAVGERRAVLWHDAVTIMGQEPLTGAGIDAFQGMSPTAVSDRDARWAHQEFLEVGAETGVPGLVLLVLVFVWAFARLWVTSGRVAALGAAAAAAIGIQASIDYVLHFPAIPIAAAVLVGSATASRRRSR